MVQIFQPEPVVHSSLGLQALCQRLQNVATCDILELGPVRGGNIEFWSRFSPTMYIADLRSSLPMPPLPSEDTEFVEPEWDRLLGLPEGRTYDVILVWDLLNYLELQVVSSLVQYLKRFCRSGTILFALIFDQKQMPATITVYHIADESHLRYENARSEMCACPRHQPRAISGVMTRFRTSNSFRLRNGVVEYLFEYEGEV
jgi:hypothetical protein